MNLRDSFLVAEAFVDGHLIDATGRACEPTVPNEVEDALVDTLILIECNKLREVINVFVSIWITHILHVALIQAAGVVDAFVAIAVDNLVAAAVFLLKWSQIEDAATEVLEHSEVSHLVICVHR